MDSPKFRCYLHCDFSPEKRTIGRAEQNNANFYIKPHFNPIFFASSSTLFTCSCHHQHSQVSAISFSSKSQP
ncbi:hypothetical protein Patl1_06893 [Pistacia atlantica]|uniref:Uncharacterized protein n=1 Tax=Pistacia atlantica TaxID=434234 RepID=A0ACC1AIV5_9ROSI|nr:hypothetical protein Patl1_06893 [Pistacia atlantica]